MIIIVNATNARFTYQQDVIKTISENVLQ